MKKLLPLAIICALLALCLSLSAFASGAPDVCVTVSADGEQISVNARGGIFYLPASADIEKLSLSFSGELSYKNGDGSYSGKISAGQTLDLTRAKAQDERGVPCYCLTLTVGGKSGDFTFYADESLASVFITTSKGLSYIEQKKDNRDKDAKITVVNENGEVEYSDGAETSSEIKGRGNATFGYYKKPYQIKLAEKTAILGMDKSKTYILLANYTDQSALHNALAFKLGEALGVPYNIEYSFVNLYIDGVYRGLYMICEKVQVDSARVDITDLEKATEKANEGAELDELLSSADKEAEATLGKLERWGGIEALCEFRKKTETSIKLNSALGVFSAVSVAVFAALPFALAALSSLLVPFLAASSLFAALSAVFFIGSGKTKKKAKEKCAELDTDYANIDEFIKASKSALAETILRL